MDRENLSISAMSSPTIESGGNSGNNSPRSSDGSKKKRKRTDTVTKACNLCRSKHLKCDGGQPCKRCNQLGASCEYQTVQTKRGPIAGKVKHLEELVGALTQQLQQTKTSSPATAVTATIPSRHHSIGGYPFNGTDNAIVERVPAGLPLDSLHLSSAVHEYLRVYMEYIYPTSGIAPPDVDLAAFWNREAGPRSSALMYSILANSALMAGDQNYAQEFGNCARSIIKEFFDVTDPLVAANHYLMGYYYGVVGEMDKAGNHTALALQMARNLLSRKREEYDTSFLYCTYVGAFVNSVEFSSDREEIWEAFNQIMEKTDNINYGNKEFMNWFTALGKTWVQIVKKRNSNPSECLPALDEAAKCVPRCNGVIRRELMSAVMAMKGVVYHFLGNHSMGSKCADEALNILTEGDTVYSSVAVMVLTIIAQLHLYENCLVSLQKDLSILKRISKFYPVAEKVVEMIVNPQKHSESSFDTTLWSMLELYPKGKRAERKTIQRAPLPLLPSANETSASIPPFYIQRNNNIQLNSESSNSTNYPPLQKNNANNTPGGPPVQGRFLEGDRSRGGEYNPLPVAVEYSSTRTTTTHNFEPHPYPPQVQSIRPSGVQPNRNVPHSHLPPKGNEQGMPVHGNGYFESDNLYNMWDLPTTQHPGQSQFHHPHHHHPNV